MTSTMLASNSFRLRPCRLPPAAAAMSQLPGRKRLQSLLRRRSQRCQRQIASQSAADAPVTRLCLACQLTETIPDLSVAGNREKWARLEAAKRRLLYTLDRLGLPYANAEPKLSFDFKADVEPPEQRMAQRGPEGDRLHGPRGRKNHDQHSRSRRCRSRTAAGSVSRSPPHAHRPFPPRDRPLLLGCARSKTVRKPSSARYSAITTPFRTKTP